MVELNDVVVLFLLLIFDKVVLSHECDSGKNTQLAVEIMTSFQLAAMITGYVDFDQLEHKL